MKITAFMTAYKFRKSEEEKENMVREHIKNEYVPYEKKADVAKAITDTCYWKTVKDDDGNEHRELYVDSVAKYMLTCMAVLDLYTDIERQKGDGKMLSDFNTLNEAGIFDTILQNVNQRELREFNMVLQETCNDVLTNEYENHAYISKQVNRFGKLIGEILSPIISQLDLNQINDIVQRNEL